MMSEIVPLPVRVPSLALTVMEYVPSFASCGAIANVPMPLWLSVKMTNEGRSLTASVND
jgi:hypothetical protein